MWNTLLLLGTAGLVGGLVRRYDRYDREPLLALLFAVALGAAACWSASHMEDALLRLLPFASESVLPLVAGVVEEGLKLLGVVLVLLTLRKHFNDPMDGITYGAFIGLGFGLCESCLVGQGGVTDALRLFFHAALGGIDGFALGMATSRIAGWRRTLAGWGTTSVVLHVAWDFVALSVESSVEVGLALRLAPLALMLSLFGFYGMSVARAMRCSKRIYAPTERTRIWGWPFDRATSVVR